MGGEVVAEKVYYNAADLINMLGVSRAGAYRIIKDLNEELTEQGCYIIKGKVSKRYLDKRMHLSA